jgi:hypothetical protein
MSGPSQPNLAPVYDCSSAVLKPLMDAFWTPREGWKGRPVWPDADTVRAAVQAGVAFDAPRTAAEVPANAQRFSDGTCAGGRGQLSQRELAPAGSGRRLCLVYLSGC